MPKAGFYENNLQIAIRNIFRRKLRNFLTFLGISVAISVFVSLLSISSGLKTQFRNIVMQYSVDIIIQPKSADSLIMSRIAVLDLERLKKINGIKEVYSLVMGAIRTSWNSYFPIIGASSIKTFASKINLTDGKLFEPDKKELLLGIAIAKRLSYRTGDKIFLSDDDSYTISGIFYSGSNFLDNGAILNIKDAQRLLKRDDYVNMAFLQLEKGFNTEKIVEAVNKEFPHLTGIRSIDYSGNSELFKMIDAFVWLISVITIFSCCLLVMNTMIMSISERIKEIGIMLAVGWSRLMIYKTLITEAVIICLSGSLIGIFISFLTLYSLVNYSGISLSWIPANISLKVAFVGVLISLVCGLISSLSPAYILSKISPAEALRYE